MTQLTMIVTMPPMDDDEPDEFEIAMADAEKTIADNPNDATGYVKRGRLHADVSYYDAAMSDLNKAIVLDDNNAEAFAIRGLVYGSYYFDDGNQQHCDYNRVMTILARQHPVRLQRRASDAKSPFELIKVIAAATKDIRNKHNPYAALIRRARAYKELADSKKMESDLAKAIECDPKLVEAYLVRAELRNHEVNDECVKADVEVAYCLDPTRPEGFTALADLYSHAGADLKDLALAAADKALDINADYAPAHFVRGKIFHRFDALPDATMEFRKTVSLDPTHAFGHLYLAECLEATGQIPQAITEYDNFVANADKVDALEIVDTVAHVTELKLAMQ